jgi:hypothetical protein
MRNNQMADNKPKTYTSPKGIANYPWLNKPDTKFNAAGVYRVKITIPAEEAETFKTFLDAQYDAGVKEEIEKAYQKALIKTPKLARQAFESKVKLADKPYKMAIDDTGEETGDLEISFKSNASFIDKKSGETVPLTVRLFDAKGKPTKALIGGGSTIKVAYQIISFPPAAFGTGISLRMQAVQVIDLQTYGGGGSGESFGFGQEEGFEDSGESNSPFQNGQEESSYQGDANEDDPNF